MKYQITNILKKAKTGLSALAFSVIGTTVYSASAFADAADSIIDGVDKTEGGSSSNTSLAEGIDTVTEILLFTIGVVAVIAIIIGGIRYATANGDQGHVTQAKNTIMYAVIGLIVALIAYAITEFVINAFA